MAQVHSVKGFALADFDGGEFNVVWFPFFPLLCYIHYIYIYILHLYIIYIYPAGFSRDSPHSEIPCFDLLDSHAILTAIGRHTASHREHFGRCENTEHFTGCFGIQSLLTAFSKQRNC